MLFRRSLLAFLLMASGAIAVNLVPPKAHADTIGVATCARCNVNPPVLAEGEVVEGRTGAGTIVTCMEFDRVEPSHCCDTPRTEVITNHGSHYEYGCYSATPRSEACPYWEPVPDP